MTGHELADLLKTYPNYDVRICAGTHAIRDIPMTLCSINHITQTIRIG